MGILADTADMRCCFLHHALSITRHLPSDHYQILHLLQTQYAHELDYFHVQL